MDQIKSPMTRPLHHAEGPPADAQSEAVRKATESLRAARAAQRANEAAAEHAPPSEAVRKAAESLKAARAAKSANGAAAAHAPPKRYTKEQLETLGAELKEWVGEADKMLEEIRLENQEENDVVAMARASTTPFKEVAEGALERQHARRIQSAKHEIGLRTSVAKAINTAAASALPDGQVLEVPVRFNGVLPRLTQGDLAIVRLPEELPESTWKLHPSMAEVGNFANTNPMSASLRADLDAISALKFRETRQDFLAGVKGALGRIHNMESNQLVAFQALQHELVELQNQNPGSHEFNQFIGSVLHEVKSASLGY